MKLRKTNRYFIILAFCSMLLLACSTNTYAKSATNYLKASVTFHTNLKRAKKKTNHKILSYYKNKKSKAIHTYKDGSKITLYQSYYNGAGGKAKYYAAHVQLKKNSSFRQRTFFGTNGKSGDFWIVVCNGQSSNGHRNDKRSKGLNMYGEGKILKKLECSYGYNLDGGGSTTMVFKGKIVTKN